MAYIAKNIHHNTSYLQTKTHPDMTDKAHCDCDTIVTIYIYFLVSQNTGQTTARISAKPTVKMW